MRRGSHLNLRMATSKQTMPQAATNSRSLPEKPDEDRCAGSNALNIALMKCFTGKYSAILVTTDDGSMGKKVPEMNTRGSSTALTIAGAASALGIATVMANPSAQKDIAPTARMSTSGPMWAGACTPYTRIPKSTEIATKTTLRINEDEPPTALTP